MATLKQIFEEMLNEGKEVGTQAFRSLYTKFIGEADEKQKALLVNKLSTGDFAGAAKIFKSYHAGGQMLNKWDDADIIEELKLIEGNKTRPRAEYGSINKSNRLGNQKDVLAQNREDAQKATAERKTFSKKTETCDECGKKKCSCKMHSVKTTKEKVKKDLMTQGDDARDDSAVAYSVKNKIKGNC
jgi:hypothetical protein